MTKLNKVLTKKLDGITLNNDEGVYTAFDESVLSVYSLTVASVEEWVKRVDASFLGKFESTEDFIRYQMDTVYEFKIDNIFIEYIDFERLWEERYSDCIFIELDGVGMVFDKSIAFNE